jgi:hypothetical protein
MALAKCMVMVAGLLFGACQPAPRRASRDTHFAEPTHYLDEWFAAGEARCRLRAVSRALTEPVVPTQKRVPEDLHVVATVWSCQDAQGAALAANAALFVHTLPSYRDDARHSHAPMRRTKLEQQAPDQLAFEVPRRDDGLLRPRIYDARTGAPLGNRERRGARIELAGASERVVIAPWPRLHDAALDHFVDRLVQTLITEHALESLSIAPEGHAALELASALTQRARAEFGGQLLSLESIDMREGQPRLVLALRGSQPDGPSLLTLEFELGATADRQPAVLRLLDAQAVSQTLSCKQDARELASAADRARKAQGDRVRCNALATLLPERCDVASPKLLREALRVGTHCENHREVQLDLDHGLEPPADFTLSLQRGRGPLAVAASLADGSARFDRVQRYAVTLDRSGKVQFESQREDQPIAWLEGRTSPQLVSALYAQLSQLSWFERSETSTRRCNGDDERGDIFRVRADGRERTVRDRDGCRGGFTPSELDNLRIAVERVTAVRAWTSPFFSEGVGEAQIWVVAADEGE